VRALNLQFLPFRPQLPPGLISTATYRHKFLTNVTASMEAMISPRDNGTCFYMYTPDPTVSNPQMEKVAGTTQLDIPSGEALRENTTGEPFEAIKLLHDTVLQHAHVYWHGEAWRAISAELNVDGVGEGRRRLRVEPHDGIEVVFINYASAPDDEDCVFELSAVSKMRARVEVMPRSECAAGIEMGLEDEGWVLA